MNDLDKLIAALEEARTISMQSYRSTIQQNEELKLSVESASNFVSMVPPELPPMADTTLQQQSFQNQKVSKEVAVKSTPKKDRERKYDQVESAKTAVVVTPSTKGKKCGIIRKSHSKRTNASIVFFHQSFS